MPAQCLLNYVVPLTFQQITQLLLLFWPFNEKTKVTFAICISVTGTLIPANAVDALTVMLKGESKKTFSNHHANFVPEDSMPLLF